MTAQRFFVAVLMVAAQKLLVAVDFGIADKKTGAPAPPEPSFPATMGFCPTHQAPRWKKRCAVISSEADWDMMVRNLVVGRVEKGCRALTDFRLSSVRTTRTNHLSPQPSPPALGFPSPALPSAPTSIAPIILDRFYGQCGRKLIR